MSEIPASKPGAPRRFLQVAAGTALIYLVLAIFYRTPDLFEARVSREFVLWPATFGLLFLYWAGYRQLRQTAVPLRWVLGVPIALALLAFSIPAFHSTDMYGYINRGWQQVQYGMNPYVFTVDHIRGWEQDPMITDHWVNNPSPYGFLYLQIAKLLTALGGGSKELTIIVFKLFNLLVHAAIAALIWLGVRKLKNGGETNALYLYAWNPLVLIHSLCNGHNDIVMGFFVTLSALFAILGQWLWILPALVAATLIKYGALVILPPAVLLLIRQRQWLALTGGTVLGAAVFLLSGLPYLPDWQSFRLSEINRNAFVSHGSLHSAIYSLYRSLARLFFFPSPEATTVQELAWDAHKEMIRGWLKNILLAGYMGFYAWLGITRLRQKEYTVPQWMFDALLVMAVMVCLVSLKFYPWYFGMFFPLAFFLPEGHWLRRLLIVMSGAQLFALTFIGQAHVLNFLVMTALPVAWLLWDRKCKKAVVANNISDSIANDEPNVDAAL